MPVTLQQHVTQRHGESLGSLLAAIADAAMRIEAKLRTASLSGALGAQGQTNVQGEHQQKLDVLANNFLIEVLRAHPGVAAIVSEENEELLVFPGKPHAEFIAIFDPLDGSSNIDVNVNVGTIVSIQRVATGQDPASAALQPGTAQVAALYVNYGPSTILVYTAGNGAHSFTVSEGQFLLNAENLHMPRQGSYYSVNEGNSPDFPQSYRDYIAALRDGTLLRQKYSARYVGSFIADFHRTLLKGGVFLYPPTLKAPAGKLRLLYEANPLAFIAEQAGGAATVGSIHLFSEPKPRVEAGMKRILELVPNQLHERTTLVIGGVVEVAAFGHMLLAAQAEA